MNGQSGAAPKLAQADSGAQAAETATLPLKLDTTVASIPHRLARYYSHGEVHRPPSGAKAYTGALAITYLPILIAALFSPLPLVTRTQTMHLPFLLDWNVAFMFLVSFPTLVALTVTDQHMLAMALRQVQMDGILLVPADVADSLVAVWSKKFRSVNIFAQVVGLATGISVATVNYIVYTPPRAHFWIASEGRLLPVGMALLWSIFCCYTFVPIYVFRSLAISFFLKDVVRTSQLHLLPFHPDRSGGLRPVGRMGVRNQYVLSVFGINVVLLAIVSVHFLGPSFWLDCIIAAAGAAYLILGPFVFLGPLLPFRSGMLRTKTEFMSQVAQRLRLELDRLRDKLSSGSISKDDEESIDRLRKLGALIDELPVWPFDAGTLRKFLTAYVIPLLGTIGYPILKSALSILTK